MTDKLPLPPLPDVDHYFVYSAEQMQSYGRECQRLALEAAAKACKDYAIRLGYKREVVMAISATRAQRRQLERDNAKQPSMLCEVPRERWPDPNAQQLRMLRSRDFLVQEFAAGAPAVVRLSVCRTSLDGDGWQEGITWDDLQRLKRECGYGNADAIEIFPADADVVNVANMRHLWVMADPVACAWRKTSQ